MVFLNIPERGCKAVACLHSCSFFFLSLVSLISPSLLGHSQQWTHGYPIIKTNQTPTQTKISSELLSCFYSILSLTTTIWSASPPHNWNDVCQNYPWSPFAQTRDQSLVSLWHLGVDNFLLKQYLFFFFLRIFTGEEEQDLLLPDCTSSYLTS